MDNVLDPGTKKRVMQRGMHLARFVAAGAANTLVSIACYQALLFFTGHLPADVISFAVGVAIAYYLYARHVFGAQTSTRSFILFAAFYIVAGLIGSLINAGLIELLGWHARLAIFATVLVMLPVNYLGSRWCLLETAAIDGERR